MRVYKCSLIRVHDYKRMHVLTKVSAVLSKCHSTATTNTQLAHEKKQWYFYKQTRYLVTLKIENRFLAVLGLCCQKFIKG